MNPETLAIWRRLAEVHREAAIRVTMAWVTLPLALAYAARAAR